MPLDYRVTLDCGHTHLYRTTVHPSEREQLTCDECGEGQHAAQVDAISADQCEFHTFTRRMARAASAANAVKDEPQLADAS